MRRRLEGVEWTCEVQRVRWKGETMETEQNKVGTRRKEIEWMGMWQGEIKYNGVGLVCTRVFDRMRGGGN